MVCFEMDSPFILLSSTLNLMPFFFGKEEEERSRVAFSQFVSFFREQFRFCTELSWIISCQSMKQKTNIMSMYTGVAYDLKLDLEMFIYVY